jgi:hypothetical protein
MTTGESTTIGRGEGGVHIELPVKLVIAEVDSFNGGREGSGSFSTVLVILVDAISNLIMAEVEAL